VQDGTLVSPFLSSEDNQSGLPHNLLDGFSIAAGTIEPGLKSKIHVMPFVTQVTFVRQGELKVCMKAAQDDIPYTLIVKNNQAIVTESGTFFQLINETEESCEVLYIVSPAYLFEQLNGMVVYDDAAVLDEDWNTLELKHLQPATKLPTIKQRQKAVRRLTAESKTKFHVR
jgi:mannose-6-phosphate isomerase-like protein (cupin superfamily)